MFLDFDNQFVNLAKVDFIGLSVDQLERDHGTKPPVEVFIYMDAEGSDPILLPYQFNTEEQANAYTHALLRRACTTGLCDKADMDAIYDQGEK